MKYEWIDTSSMIDIFNSEDQEFKADTGKPKLTLVPHQILYDIARVREYGNMKYPEGGKDNWKKVEIERYRDAAFRHFLLYLQNPKGMDEESGLSHLSHLACNIAFLCELEKEDDEDKDNEGLIKYIHLTKDNTWGGK